MLATSTSRSALISPSLFLPFLFFAFIHMICQAGRDMDAVTRFNQAVAAASQQEGRGRDLSLAFANRLPAIHYLGRLKATPF